MRGAATRAVQGRPAGAARSIPVAPAALATVAFTALVASVLGGCDAGERIDVTTLDADGTLGLEPPVALQVRAVDTANLVPSVLVNGRGIVVTRTNDQWAARVTVPEGSDPSIAITWFELIGTTAATRVRLPLARLIFTTGTIVEDRTFVLNADDYETGVFDSDADGISNLAERIGDSSPFDAADPGDDFANALLPRIAPAEAPTIDGAYDPIWDRAQYRDVDGDELAIDNLMIDRGGVLLDGDSGYRWGAMHDGEALYLLVFAEAGTGQTPFGDSMEAFQDDSVDVFVDADSSRLSAYDGVDDRHLILPLLDSNGGPNISGGADARFDLGPFTAPFEPDAVTFATCPCRGGMSDDVQVYELRVPLADFDIVVDTTIGFEVQVNDDRDGGERDVKWGWFHPSRVNRDTDETYRDPGFMGRVRLEP